MTSRKRISVHKARLPKQRADRRFFSWCFFRFSWCFFASVGVFFASVAAGRFFGGLAV
jgi:hypothetical protein